jgi:hypothetical protein
MNLCLMLKGNRDTAASIYKYKKKPNVDGNKEREITDCWLYLILIYCLNDHRNDKSVTVRNKYSRIPQT